MLRYGAVRDLKDFQAMFISQRGSSMMPFLKRNPFLFVDFKRHRNEADGELGVGESFPENENMKKRGSEKTQKKKHIQRDIEQPEFKK